MSVRTRDEAALFVLALLARLTVASLVSQPGYMDAAYYTAGGINLAQGGGLNEPFIWNYLDNPAGIPHIGFVYWMPLPALLVAPFAALFPGSFFALQIPFAFFSALLPVVAYSVAWGLTARRSSAWLAGLLTLFSGFFFPYWSLPETFAPFALFGSLALWLSTRPSSPASRLSPLAAGLLVGLAHLTRADGVLLLPVVALGLLMRPPRPRVSVSSLFFLVLGYLLVMGPWFVRNLVFIGAPLSPSGTRTLWLRTYDDLYCYGCDLSLRTYLGWGWAGILRSKLWALGVNLARFMAENCMVFLFPLVLAGLYRLRRQPVIAVAVLYLLLVYLAHSLAFTFPGPRGGFFHTGAALLPFLHPAAAEGLDVAVGWAARRRRWNHRQARAVFTVAAVAFALLLSLYAVAGKIPQWRQAGQTYAAVDRWLEQHQAEGTIMVGDPPSFWYFTRRPCVVVPNGDVETVLAVARRYRVTYLLLDENRPIPLARFYAGAERDMRLTPAVRIGAAIVYRVQE